MYKLYSDGGARGNPGPAGIGVVIYNENDEIIKEISHYLGKATNNQAEYQALIAGLEFAVNKKIKKISCHLDSELVVKQLNGQYKVKDAQLSTLFLKIWNLKHAFEKIEFIHIRREKNTYADRLVNEALDKAVK